jgi:hypothetical protein
MKYCKQFNKFCDDDCLNCYDYIGSINRKQYKYELRKKYGYGTRGDNAIERNKRAE